MSTPSHIATRLEAAGWHPINADTWQRPGPHPDAHSWPVADLIRRDGEPHHTAPPMPVERRPRKPGLQHRGSNRSPAGPRPVGLPRKADLIRRVAAMHDKLHMTFAAIAAEIGGKPSRVFYLYKQAGKLTTG